MSIKFPLSSRRQFQIWEYQVSHGHLLVRSPKKSASNKSPEQLTNLDIHFWGVDYLELPRSLKGIEIVEPSEDELILVESVLSREVDPENVTILFSENKRFIVVSAGLKVSVNEWDIFDSPIEFRSQYRTMSD